MSTVIVVGNPKPKSRTFQAAQVVAQRLTGEVPSDADVIDLADLGAELLDWGSLAVAESVARLKAADLAVIATPTFKGTYTGLLKLFLDRFGAGSLATVTAIPLMLGGDWRHSLAVEAFLKPVLAEIGASTPTKGLFLIDSEAADGWAGSETLTGWLEVARLQLPARLLGATTEQLA